MKTLKMLVLLLFAIISLQNCESSKDNNYSTLTKEELKIEAKKAEVKQTKAEKETEIIKEVYTFIRDNDEKEVKEFMDNFSINSMPFTKGFKEILLKYKGNDRVLLGLVVNFIKDPIELSYKKAQGLEIMIDMGFLSCDGYLKLL